MGKLIFNSRMCTSTRKKILVAIKESFESVSGAGVYTKTWLRALLFYPVGLSWRHNMAAARYPVRSRFEQTWPGRPRVPVYFWLKVLQYVSVPGIFCDKLVREWFGLPSVIRPIGVGADFTLEKQSILSPGAAGGSTRHSSAIFRYIIYISSCLLLDLIMLN